MYMNSNGFKYIQFCKRIYGNDGFKYETNVKYGISQETDESYFLLGKKGNQNEFKKQNIVGFYEIGNIVKER